jgi:CHAT domain-containing protein
LHPIYLEWAEIHRQRGDRAATARSLDEALASVERLNDQIARLHFDPVRRSVYETTIEFHLEDAPLTAWETNQRYRTRLDTTILPLFGQAATRTEAPIRVPDFDDRTIVEYTLLEDRLLIWVVADGILRHQEVPLNRDEFTEEVQRFIHYVSRPDPTDSLSTLEGNLYRTLIFPVRDWLDPSKPLVIIPDRILHRLPFSALTSPDGRFLIEDFAIAESTTLARALHDAPAWSESPRMLAVGPQYPSVEMKRELDAVEGFYPGIEMMGSQATRDGFLEKAHGVSMLHVTGHSAIDGASGLTSAILLDGVDGPNRITAADVAGLELDSGSLVILASCDSSVGNAIGGIGVRGLTSAFLAAGAGAVAGSLWPVEDQVTGELMTSFHQSLSDGETVSGALRQAQLEMIEDNRHPYEWAAFIVTGDRTATRPIPASARASVAPTEEAAVSP